MDVPESHRVSLDAAAVRPLLAALEDEYEIRYGPGDELTMTHPAEFEPPDGAFIVLLDAAGVTVAGGGFRRFSDDACEVKRMWTSPAHRRQGLAARVLGELEDLARSVGYQRVVLETGPAQPEAHTLYRTRGYAVMPTFGRYTLATAYEKSLT
jgi:GNAT superfamily N-acetyltransferase